LTDFLAKAPTLDANWRAVVLFGRNVASYKFALAKTLLGMTDSADDRVMLEELAAPFACHLCEHLRQVDKQATSRSSKFLDAYRTFNRGELSEDALVDTTAKLGFINVIGAFHVVGSGPVPLRFFEDERAGSHGGGAIRLTEDLRRLAGSMQGQGLAEEAEARWRLMEAAWQLDLPRAGIAVQADVSQDLLFVEQDRRIRRTSLTRVRGALNGYQRGRCFYCRAETPLAATDVDHFFPWVLKERGEMPDAAGVWNLVLARRYCNRGERGKFASIPAPRLVACLHEHNNWLVDSHHPLRETIMLQTGADTKARASFLRTRQRIALDALVHERQPMEVATDG
jgi:HNH endonuclease